MTETLLSLVTGYGATALALITFLSCLALPVPASLAMLAGGGFVAADDLELVPTLLAALAGAVMGDNLGFAAGRFAGSGLVERLATRPKRGALLRRASADLDRNAPSIVYLSRWLVSPLGPYVNLVAGATGLPWSRFVLADLAGEATWVTLYVGLGYAFADSIDALSDILGNLTGLLAALAVAAGAGIWLVRASRAHSASKRT